MYFTSLSVRCNSIFDLKRQKSKTKISTEAGKEVEITWRRLQTFPPNQHFSSPTDQAGPGQHCHDNHHHHHHHHHQHHHEHHHQEIHLHQFSLALKEVCSLTLVQLSHLHFIIMIQFQTLSEICINKIITSRVASCCASFSTSPPPPPSPSAPPAPRQLTRDSIETT